MTKIIGAILAAVAVSVTVAGCNDEAGPVAIATGTSSVREAPGSTAPGGGAPSGGGSSPGGGAQPGSGSGGSQPGSGGATQASPVSNTTPQPGASGGNPVTAGHGLCLDVNSGVVNTAITTLEPAPGGTRFVVDSGSNAPLGSCPALLWVRVATPRGTASSPWHVLFFNHDGYLGTATSKATAYTTIVGSSDRAVQVQYRWLQGSDASCCPSGGPVVITFTLGADGHTITPDPAIPAEVTAAH